ncbi:hypothetical protein KY342_03505 [Candidatus Woesearchaeota archaeon]|nr:hypothetical protein [Candidatus Woesearchaeota archaeon]
MGILTEIIDIFFKANYWQAWLFRISLVLLIGVITYLYLPRLNRKFRFFNKKISPELKEKENIILKKLKRLNEEGDVLKRKKKLLSKQINDIIEQGMELKKLEEGIEIKKQSINQQKLSDKSEKLPKEGLEKSKTSQRKKTNEEEDIQQFLKMIDDWLGKLPEKTVDEFSKSEDFKVYKRVLEKYRIN